MDSKLVDSFGREIDYIRLSVTDRCDFRCRYCMAEDMVFLSRTEVLRLEEYERLVRVFAKLGVRKVRITGGEPLVRKGIVSLLARIGLIEGIQEVTLTTNGSQLARMAQDVYQAGVRRINVSLDSLSPEHFRQITRVGKLETVLDGIQVAQQVGLHVRINSVLMRGINDHEALDLLEFALHKGLDIAFIEEMPLGDVGYARHSSMVSNAQILEILSQRYTLLPIEVSSGGPARYWQILGTHSKIGFISPHSHNFCGNCNRVRVSCQGELFLCLGQEHKIELKPWLRNYPNDDEPLIRAIRNSMLIKPESHTFDLHKTTPAVVRFMSHTGG